jgi:YVTN family beta-propeller protein
MMKRLSIVLSVAAALVITTTAASDPNHPTGSKGLFLVDKLGGQVRFLDPVTYKERAAVKLPANPHDFVLNPDHTIAYVPIYGDGIYGRNANPGHEIDIVDLQTQKVVGTIDVSPYRAPHGIQLAPDGTLFVTSDLDRKLLVVDPKARTVKAAIDTEGTGHWVGMLPDGSKLYVTNKNDKPFVSVIDAKSRTMIGKVATPNGTQGIAVAPDGRRVVVMDLTEPVALIIDPKTDSVVDRVRLKDQTTGGYKVYFSPDGKMAAHDEQPVHDDQHSECRRSARRAAHGDGGQGSDGVRVLRGRQDGARRESRRRSVSVIDLQKGQATTKFQAGTGIETLAFY